MKAEQFAAELEASPVPNASILETLQRLRHFLASNLTTPTGVTGFLFRKLFPKTHAGIEAVVRFLDEVLVILSP